jgi:hypothetical protein
MISVVVLVCLLIMTLICGTLLHMIQSQRALVRSEERRLQADWLADSGVERALARLSDDPGYRGETWALSAQELGGSDAGVVTITVDAPRLVIVQADYPVDPTLRVRSRRQVTLDPGRERKGVTR